MGNQWKVSQAIALSIEAGIGIEGNHDEEFSGELPIISSLQVNAVLPPDFHLGTEAELIVVATAGREGAVARRVADLEAR